MKLVFIFSIEWLYIKPCQTQNGSSPVKFKTKFGYTNQFYTKLCKT
jgi:hypothetical protein